MDDIMATTLVGSRVEAELVRGHYEDWWHEDPSYLSLCQEEESRRTANAIANLFPPGDFYRWSSRKNMIISIYEEAE